MNGHKMKKRKPNWKKEGMKSNGLYNTVKKSPLSDSPPIGNELREVIRDYMTKYKEQKGTTASYTHLNKKYGLRATGEFYKNL